MFDTLRMFLKENVENVNFEKKSADNNKIMKNYPAYKEEKAYTFLALATRFLELILKMKKKNFISNL